MLRISDAALAYGDVEVIDSLTVGLASKECLAVLGASGSGKSTILRAIVSSVPGFRQNGGSPLRIGGKIEISASTIGYVPQEASLASWLTVRRNIELIRSLVAAETKPSFDLVVNALGLRSYLAYYPRQLSVGTAKRVALARALVYLPQLLLLDEPFAGFDFDIRERAISLIQDLKERGRTACILVTHDPYEVACLASQAVVLNGTDGREIVAVSRGQDSREAFQSSVFSAIKKVVGCR